MDRRVYSSLLVVCRLCVESFSQSPVHSAVFVVDPEAEVIIATARTRSDEVGQQFCCLEAFLIGKINSDVFVP